ncbi:DUF1707 domain-containing protein [Luteococcus peritonei]|uniref:DUF1707 domain-containing protein n=1 Tax=Luteococcus peritonei TaxID=88874 RepID=A0ABW4RX32_9ACTN
MDFSRTLLSDDDRARALDALTEHYVDRRLGLDEHDRRSTAVLQARTVADLDEPFDGLPGGAPFEAGPSGQPVLRPAVVASSSQQAEAERAELAELVRKGKVMDKVDAVVGTLCFGTFVVLQFFTEVDHAWLAIVVGLVLSLTARAVVGFDDDDEEDYEQIKEQQAEERAERRRLAMQHRAELER